MSNNLLKVPKFILNLLELPQFYLILQQIVGAVKARQICLLEYGDIQSGHRVLDVGCGPGYVLDLLKGIEYLGFDVEKKYIDYAKNKYINRGEFRCEFLTPLILEAQGKFDRIILMGVLHHLSDDDYLSYFKMLKSALLPGGKIITLDGVFEPNQSWIARKMLENDRGDYVRDKKGYLDIAESIFPKVSAILRKDFFRIPYSSLVMVCEV